jgi:hypothetical protein
VTARKILEVAIKAFGLWILIRGLVTAVSAIGNLALILSGTDPATANASTVIYYASVSLLDWAIGAAVVALAPRLARWADSSSEPLALPPGLSGDSLFPSAVSLVGIYVAVTGLTWFLPSLVSILSPSASFSIRVPSSGNFWPASAQVIAGVLLIYNRRLNSRLRAIGRWLASHREEELERPEE